MRCMGRIRAGATMAASSPASRASCRNTELSTWRAAGARPKETLETPRMVRVPGSSALIRRIASRVATASPRRSSWPDPSGKVRASKTRSSAARPCLPTARSWMRWAMRSFQSTSRAWPSSSISRATRAAPYWRAIGQTASMRASPSSRLMELMMAQALEPGLEHVGLGRVEHDGHGRLLGQPGGQDVHVGHAVAAHVVDAHVQDVGALSDLLLGDAGHAVQVALEHQVAELARPVGVAALTHGQVGGVLVEGDRLVEAGQAGLVVGLAGGGGAAAQGLHHLADVLGGGPAAPAYDRETELGREPAVGLGQLLRGERVPGPAVAQLGQPGVGQA